MKTLILMLSMLGCSVPVSSIPDPLADQRLYWCLPDGDGIWDAHGSKPDCSRISRGEWDRLPILVMADDALIAETVEAIDYLNRQVGIELFRYTTNRVPDVGVIVSGEHKYAAMQAQHMTLNGRRVGAVLAHNGFEDEDRVDIVAHELGHILGLRHDHDNKTSLMYPSIAGKLKSLERRDIALLRRLYGR